MSDPLARLIRDLAARSRNAPHDPEVRVAVAARAVGRCEYCLLPTGGQFQIDHIVPPRRWQEHVDGQLGVTPPIAARRGPDHLDNFAWCCPFCNQHKLQQVGLRGRGHTTRLLDPRNDDWSEQFAFVHQYLFIVGVTDIGKATVRALGFNDPKLMGPLGIRHVAIGTGAYPPDWARPLLIPT